MITLSLINAQSGKKQASFFDDAPLPNDRMTTFDIFVRVFQWTTRAIGVSPTSLLVDAVMAIVLPS